ncbi:SRPBCC family protein [Salsipaludibacter albus]|uniref:SRPBCC family protein n=1 Tax=Salsipaludibacter albus TaxID=2849650 RepID=UPI001EE44A7C
MASDTYTVSRSARIDAPRAVVHDLLVDFHAWTRWSPWEDVDPEMERTYAGSDRGVGARYAWRGNRRAGAGSMEITRVTDDLVGVDLLFTKPFKARNELEFRLDDADGTTTDVTWTMTGRRTLMTRVMGLVRSMDDLVGPDFERGLVQLDRAATTG